MNNKWKLHYGIHRGTIISRDSDLREFDTEEEARADYRESKKFHKSIGYHVWFAHLISPAGKKTVLDAGVPYKR